MPTITLSKEELFKTLGKRLSDDKLKDRISMLGTDLEGIDGDSINVEIFPNRPDLLSQQGFARALASFTGIRPGLVHYKVEPSGEKVIIDKSTQECRPYTACAIIRNLHITEERLKEIIQVQEKLHITFCRNRKRAAIGIYPIEHITFPIHFKGLKPEEIRFRPLESEGEMTAKQILEEHPKGKEYAYLVEKLQRYACFLDAKGNIMSLTPIINSHLTGKITEKTTEVFVECSGFDLRILQECLNMIVAALADMGGTIHSLVLEYPDRCITTPDLTPRKIQADRAYINRLLGLKLSESQFGKLLERMGYGYENGHVFIPAYRTDILHQVDLAEDVAIAYGYEKVPEVIPNVATIAQEAPLEVFMQKLHRRLVGHGLLETKNYQLINTESQTAKMLLQGNVVMLANAVSLEYDSLRASLLPSLFETLQRNKRHEYPQDIFELGRVFSKGKSETGVVESTNLAAARCGERADYTAIRQLLDDLLDGLGLNATYSEHEHPSFIYGRLATVSINGTRVALIGEVHPQVLENFELEMPVAAFEVELDALLDVLSARSASG
jgi:phenylalanyl-tRNA synthetase beta chain